jgi:hypothetical protein
VIPVTPALAAVLGALLVTPVRLLGEEDASLFVAGLGRW